MEILFVVLIIALIAFAFSLRGTKVKGVEDVNTAKLLIAETYKKYATLAFDNEKSFFINFDYENKTIEIFDENKEKLEEVSLPTAIKYATVYGGSVQNKVEAKITSKGNISPVFSIYIFAKNNIAKYRISLYGFDALKHIKINVYKNISDKSARYDDILNFHTNFQADSNTLWEKE